MGKTGMEHSRNTADPRQGNGSPSRADIERIATQAELQAVRREYRQLMQLANAIQLSFLALARSLNVPPSYLAEFIANEPMNKAYEEDTVRELSRVRADKADVMAKVAKP